MRAKRLGVLLCVAAAFVVGCLDDGGGARDQWMNTDAYVAPEVGTSSGEDGGVSCGDAPAFGSPTRLSDDLEPDGGPLHVQYGVAMAGGGNDGGAVHVAWLDRDVTTMTGDVRVVRVPAGASTGTILDVQRPTGCDLLTDPALAVTAAGTVILAATCITGTELAVTQTRIVAFRSTDGLGSFGDAIPLTTCDSATAMCGYPTMAARADGVVLFAWTHWTIDQGATSAITVKVWRSDDDGLTAPTEITLPGTFAATAGPRLAVDPNDDVHLAFLGAFSLDGTSYTGYARLATDTEFGTPEVLGPAADTPSLAAASDAVYVVWPAGTGGATLEEAHDTGAGFSPAAALAQPAGTLAVLSPVVAAGPDGSVHLFWLAGSDAGLTAYYSVSTDKAVGWSDPLLISGPFDGVIGVGSVTAHQVGAIDLVATGEDVTLGWGDPMSSDQITGVTNVYLARRVCP